jgi:hypothetical protein
MDTVATCVLRALAFPMVWVDSNNFDVGINSDMYNSDFCGYCCFLLFPLLLVTACTDLCKGKAIPVQYWTGPGVSRRLGLPDFKTFGIRK